MIFKLLYAWLYAFLWFKSGFTPFYDWLPTRVWHMWLIQQVSSAQVCSHRGCWGSPLRGLLAQRSRNQLSQSTRCQRSEMQKHWPCHERNFKICTCGLCTDVWDSGPHIFTPISSQIVRRLKSSTSDRVQLSVHNVPYTPCPQILDLRPHELDLQRASTRKLVSEHRWEQVRTLRVKEKGSQELPRSFWDL